MQTDTAHLPSPLDAAGAGAHAGRNPFTPSLATPRDYFELLKPRVMSLVVFTALVGMVAAPGHINPVIGLTALVFIAIGAGASGALNMWYEADIDARMSRTAQRPIPQGVIRRGEVLGFAIFLAVLAVVALGLLVNVLSAALLAFTIFFYAVIYTMWLKRSTPQNIVIGGAAGAFPPMIAWAAATGEVSTVSVLMFAVIFIWTPPHFWALALFRNDDYARVGVPMMPVVAGEASTRRQIWFYSLLLAPVAVAPAFTVAGGPVYLTVALAANAAFLRGAWRVSQRSQAEAVADGYRAEKKLFGISIGYLFAIFAAFILEAALGAMAGPFGWPVWF